MSLDADMYQIPTGRECRYPLGDKPSDARFWCRDARLPASPYCEIHHNTCYQVGFRPQHRRKNWTLKLPSTRRY